VHLVGRSFKYHRPRGILRPGSEEPNGMVTVIRDEARTTPNLRVTQVELYEGLKAVSQNRWPSLQARRRPRQRSAVAVLPGGLLLQDFHVAEARVEGALRARDPPRRGSGEAPTLPDPDRYSQRYAHCDVLVVGAGPAGIAAAAPRRPPVHASCSAMNKANSAAACCRNPARASTAWPRSSGCGSRSPRLRAIRA
jgi:sarcosine oxidase, subunit alpha